MVLHALHELQTSNGNVCTWCTSGDTDILVIAIGLISQTSRILVDSANGSKRRKIWLNSIQLNESQCKALISFHNFSGNDNLLAFFQKGKQLCWKRMPEKDNFRLNFIELGSSWDISDNLQAGIEKFVCHLYSSNKSSVDDSRFQIFEKSNCRQSRSMISTSYPLVRVG